MRFNFSNLEALFSSKDRQKGKSSRLVLKGMVIGRFFVIALIAHVILVALFGGKVLMSYFPAADSFEPTRSLLVLPESAPPPPPPATVQPTQTREVKVNARPAPETRRIVTRSPQSAMSAAAPDFAPEMKMKQIKVSTNLDRRIDEARKQRLAAAKDFQKDWKVKGRGRQIAAEFTIFEAKYQNGDWDCNPGAVPNLLRQIRQWSNDRIKAKEHPEVLDVGSDALFTLKPPFVYLTGHRDFTLTEAEIKNLRDYLLLGGCIWADSALAGRRSRFDVAFRREMKRVLPDRSFVEIPENHEIFDAYFQNLTLPAGMNHYREPVEMITVNDELAVIYTSNGYGHFWEARLDERDEVIRNTVWTGQSWDHVYGPHWHIGTVKSVLYRNYEQDSIIQSYRFSINVVAHLLTRYQDKFMAIR